jgi:hypothetical protein
VANKVDQIVCREDKVLPGLIDFDLRNEIRFGANLVLRAEFVLETGGGTNEM